MKSLDKKDAALYYASKGFFVLPLGPNTKKPLTDLSLGLVRGFYDATTDQEKVLTIWQRYPDANIGIATEASQMVVLDPDGDVGRESLNSLELSVGLLPMTVTVITPGKLRNGKHEGEGSHLWYRDTLAEKGHKSKIGNNIDIKGRGGYIVVPPSTHPDGGTYQYSPGKSLEEIKIAELPPMWIKFLVKPTLTLNPVLQENQITQSPENLDSVFFDEKLRKRAKLYIEKCGPAIQGQHGHAKLLTVANALVHGYCLKLIDATDFAWQYYNPKCLPPWTEGEREDFDRKFFEAATNPPNKRRGWLLKGQSRVTDSLTDDGDNGSTSATRLLDPDRTKPTAEAFIQHVYYFDSVQTLYYLNGDFYEWRHNAYRLVSEARLRAEVLDFIDNASIEIIGMDGKRHLKQYPAKKTSVDSIIDALKGVAFMDSNTPVPCWLGDDPAPVSDPMMVMFGKTTNLDVSTMKTFDPSPKWFNYNAIDVDYVMPCGELPSQCPRWDQFLSQLFCDDEESKQALLMFMGLLLTPLTKFQKALFIVGPKRSGKGTIARIIKKLVGDINFCGPTTEGLASHFGLQQLIGKSVAIVSDARFSGQNQSILTERILTITGEDTLTIDRKYHSASTMRLPTRFVFLSNELPRLTDSAGALAGRFIVLKLTKSFYGEEDLELENKLLSELPGILAQAIVALKDLLKQGRFKQPESARDDVLLLENLTSPISHFIRERCEVGAAAANEWTATTVLYEAWKKWCYEEGIQAVGTSATFCRNLIAFVPELMKQRSSDSDRPRGYRGIRLLP